MSKHTPGPWVSEVIDKINGEPAYWHIVQKNKKGVVGDVQSVNFADAQLISAAPDLLAALKELTFIVETVAHLQGHESILLPITDKARAIIEKAEG